MEDKTQKRKELDRAVKLLTGEVEELDRHKKALIKDNATLSQLLTRKLAQIHALTLEINTLIDQATKLRETLEKWGRKLTPVD